MTNPANYLKVVKQNYLIIVLGTLLAVALAFFLTVLRPLNYASTTEVMVIQKQLTETDSYLSAKSAEKIAASLAQVVYSTSFFQKVEQSGQINLSQFNSLADSKERQAWQEAVEVEVVPNTGIIQITAYDRDPARAQNFSESLAYTLVNNSSEYHGGGENIQVKMINSALTSKYPVKPNLLVNLIMGFSFGLASTLIYLFLRPEVKVSQSKAKPKLEVNPVLEEEPFSAPSAPLVSPVSTALSYSVLDQTHYPEVENIYQSAPKVSTMYDHLTPQPPLQ